MADAGDSPNVQQEAEIRGDASGCRIMRSGLMNQSHIHGLRGLPEDFVMNLTFGLFYLLIFTIFRCMYHRRKYWIHEWNSDWITFFYGNRPIAMLHTVEHINRRHPHAYLPPALRPDAAQIWNRHDAEDHSRHRGSVEFALHKKLDKQIQAEHEDALASVGRGLHCWLWDYLTVSTDAIYRHRGHDPALYLMFERYLIIWLILLTVVSLFVTLPLNYFGGSVGKDAFEHTTINAIAAKSPLLWIHVVIAVAIVVGNILYVKWFTSTTHCLIVQDDRTILIQNVGVQGRNARRLARYIERRFEPCEVTRVTLTYDVMQLTILRRQLAVVRQGVVYAQNFRRMYGFPLRVTPGWGGQFCWWGTGILDGLAYYQRQERRTAALIRDEVARLSHIPEHAVFVQFQTYQQARKVLAHIQRTTNLRQFRHDCYWLKSRISWGGGDGGGGAGPGVAPAGDWNDKYNYLNWEARPAPVPEDIVWEDVVLDTDTVGVTSLVLTLFIFAIFLCLSSPLVALNYLNAIVTKLKGNGTDPSGSKPPTNRESSMLDFAQYLSPIALSILTPLLNKMIYEVIMRVPRITRTEKMNQVLTILFVYLFMANYVLPSVGLVSIRLLVQNATESGTQPDFFARCLFPSENSAWFLKLVMAAGITACAMDLLRVVEILFYIIDCIMYPRTEAEFLRARQPLLPFSVNFATRLASVLLNYTIVITYCVSCPLIVPVGLFYMTVHYNLMKYQFYYMYDCPEILTVDMMHTAVFIVLFANLMLLLQLSGYLLTDPRTFTIDINPTTVMLVAFIAYVGALLSFRWFITIHTRHSTEWDATPYEKPPSSSALDKWTNTASGRNGQSGQAGTITGKKRKKRLSSSKKQDASDWIPQPKNPGKGRNRRSRKSSGKRSTRTSGTTPSSKRQTGIQPLNSHRPPKGSSGGGGGKSNRTSKSNRSSKSSKSR